MDIESLFHRLDLDMLEKAPRAVTLLLLLFREYGNGCIRITVINMEISDNDKAENIVIPFFFCILLQNFQVV